MIPDWVSLNDQDRAALRVTIQFLHKRLAESATIDWALRLKPTQRIERVAIKDLLNGPGGTELEEPWATAWRLIEESWSVRASEEEPSTAIYGIQRRLRGGDRSGALMSGIVRLVAPYLKVKPIDSWHWQFIKKPRRAKTFDQLLFASLTSGNLVDLNVLKLENLTDVPFLRALATSLEGAINNGLDIGRRLGWDGQPRLWRLGDLGRVYYVTTIPGAPRNGDPDAFHHGIAPSVKLLDAVVSRIAALEGQAAARFVKRWRLMDSPVHTRLWAAAARNSELTTPEQVGEFLRGLDDRHFWDLQAFPEIAELRARRFGQLDTHVQEALTRRLRKGPPREYWPRKAEVIKVKNDRIYRAIRELKRIEIAGGVLPRDVHAWLEESTGQFANLVTMTIDSGFPRASETYSVPPNPDEKYDTLVDAARLRALETALASTRGDWDDDPAERANDWIRQPGKAELVLADLESTGNGGDAFPRVWGRFGWALSSPQRDTPQTPGRDLQAEADHVLALLNQLSDATLAAAIEGICAWLDSWENQVVVSELGLPVWLRIWPIAVEATNAEPEQADETDLSVTARPADGDREPLDLDTLNTPAGKLIGVFLAACRLRSAPQNPFKAGSIPRRMRDTMIEASGRSGLIARRRLIEYLPYLLQADRDWTEENLIGPLLNDDGASLALWRAIARQTQFTEVLKIIGSAMAERATDRRLGRETRRSLVFSLVVECLHAFRERREPAVPNARIQQMLRTLDDEVRASAANAVQRFVRDLSSTAEDEQASAAADLFRSTAKPFLEQVWPQERSLATPGVSGAFAALPAKSGEAFVEAVDVVERFLVPFDCWSMADYGLFGEGDEATKLATIDNKAKAEAFLRLLDSTVGTSEGAVVPYDTANALDQIQSVWPRVIEHPIYRRLSAATRR
jgi:hypothetical protein